jgi:hypothetical protein
VQFSEHGTEPLTLVETEHFPDAVSLAAERAIATSSARPIPLCPRAELTFRAAAQRPDWDGSLAHFPTSSFFHTKTWARVIERTYGFAPRHFTFYEEGTVVSILPMMEVGSRLAGRRGVSLPFTDSCEPLYRDIASGKQMVETILAFGKRHGWNSVEFRGGGELFEDSQASVSFHAHILNLETSEDRQFRGFSASVRRAIRKAQRAGVTSQVSQTREAMRLYYSLHCMTRRRHGLPSQSFAFFDKIYEEVLSRNLGAVVLAFYRGVPIAGNLYLRCGNRAIYKFGASNKAFQHLRGSNLAMWDGIRWLIHGGSKVLDFGRTSLSNQGLRKFKLGWGAVEKPLHYFKYDFRTDRFVTQRELTQGCYNSFFKAMPLFLSRPLGAALYRLAA